MGGLKGVFTGLQSEKPQQTGNLCSKGKTPGQRKIPKNCLSTEKKHASAAKS